MGGDSSSTADAKKRKTKKLKRGLVSTEQGDVAIPPILLPCSSDTGSSSSKKKICFWGKEKRSRNISWFVMNIPMDLKQPTEEMNELAAFDHHILHRHIERNGKEITLTPVLSLLYSPNPIIPVIYNTYATLGSFVYSIGGCYRYPCGPEDTTLPGCNLVFCIDTNNKDDDYCWKRAPSMISHRQKSQVITVNDKLYVFGCFGEDRCPHNPKCCSWAEVFDPSTGKWSSLPVPKFEDNLSVWSPNHLKKNHVVKKIAALADDGYLYQLDIQTVSWDHIATVGNGAGLMTQPVALVDSTFYWFTEHAHAYDMMKDENFEGPVQDYSFQHALNMTSEQYNGPTNAIKPKFVHLGKRYFCVLGNLSDLEEGSRRIHCLLIKLSKTEQWYKYPGEYRSKFLRARILSCHSFPIDRELEFLDCRIM